MMRTIVRMLIGLCAGIAIGFAIAALGLVCFKGMTFTGVIEKFCSVKFSESIIAVLTGGIAFIASWLILIPIHELGHLICGLLTGYKFVSFRIFNLTVIKTEAGLRVKRFAVAGTGGQCLLSPPEVDIKDIPTGWYNFGGVLANILVLPIAIALLWMSENAYVTEALWMFLLADIVIILLNGIPLKVSGVSNDGYNMVYLRKNQTAKLGLVNALRSNAMLQGGIRLKEMPDEWFRIPEKIDYSNQLEISLPLMAASRLVDEMNYRRALDDFEQLYRHRDRILPLYVKEIACELVFLRLMCGESESASELIDDDLRKYLMSYRNVMSSKERILCAITLLIDHNKEKAVEIYRNLLTRKEEYLLQGEVKSDLALMEVMLR